MNILLPVLAVFLSKVCHGDWLDVSSIFDWYNLILVDMSDLRELGMDRGSATGEATLYTSNARRHFGHFLNT